MNKNAIKKFAIDARNKLIASVTDKAGMLGITQDNCSEAITKGADFEVYKTAAGTEVTLNKKQCEQRRKLVDQIHARGFEAVVEEVAYTWFNRICAIRFMEVNDYMYPVRVRVLSSEKEGKNEPDVVTMAPDIDWDFTDKEREEIIDAKMNGSQDELFRKLFLKQCNLLHEVLPGLFEGNEDYMEPLLTLSYTDKDGIIYHLIHDIEEDDFNVEKEGQVEIIGWLYQYYISEKHDEIVNIYKGTIKKDDIPAATQLFTTDWVVRYMVDNSLGRYWIERNPQSKLAEKLEFFVTPKNGEIQYVDEKVSPADLTFFDPCMGSGHILVYAFDVLMEIYREGGYSDRDAALNIVENNIFGMDIDKRAYQLAYFAVMMKARSYNRRALTQGIKNHLAIAEESNSIDKFECDGLTNNKEKNKIGDYLVKAYKDAREIGTLQTIEKQDYDSFRMYLNDIEKSAGQLNFLSTEWLNGTLPLMFQLTKQAEIMSNKYAVVCTNPPYMNKLEGQLKKFVIDYYKEYSGDLFSVFIYRNFGYCKANGYSAFMTPFVWMFIKTYEALRRYIINSKHITSLIQMEYSAFEEATVPICSFVLKNEKSNESSLCFRLSDFKGGMQVQKEKVLEALSNKECGYFYETNQKDFMQIPGTPIAYWVGEQVLKAFSSSLLEDYGYPKQGFATGNNDTFLRFWHEVDFTKIGFNMADREEASKSNKKWFPCNKGGAFRRWYGNNTYLANWEFDGKEMTEFKGSVIRNPQFYFRQGMTWSSLTSGKLSMRYSPKGFLFESKGSVCFMKDENNLLYILGLMNTSIVSNMLLVLSPTLDYHEGPMSRVPIIISNQYKNRVEKIVKENIEMCKEDWDSFEISWDFKQHPLVKYSVRTIKEAFDIWTRECDVRYISLKNNEEELNKIFTDIYGLNGEVSVEVDEKDISVHRADLQREIKGLISYAVGCMFGRYSVNEGGLTQIGKTILNDDCFIDKDNCIPITDEEYFLDDIVGKFCEWLKLVYGEDTLEDNLKYIANALGNKGKTGREIIREYFVTDFIKDHIKMYQKRPIYWLFDSGKQNGFKALIYMHRYDADTVGRVRTDYLHKAQKYVETAMQSAQYTIDNATTSSEKSKATKAVTKYTKQLAEMKIYDEAIAHVANQRIEIDLDDGVKVNYAKFQGVEVAQEGKKALKVDLLAKI
ncbi:BREX-1 system adenine-specific DNA-methyltransferase PglX [Clostridium sp. AF23-6LB]|uniref:BREX-1 system adenine-specific DNA-methyltransferase PglX n=1 Tax=Clostridium sp. AF23-6LB TaxID=2293005 RepID=UPI000E4FD9AB|nr:BREX-1 system adenine-specific DNA-methyltransferase PglX [Clostridium sp. AF23-6LB]RGG37288.1 BREX-1 system adenine-specific DNA-methyltransferase PglX [Clostridium sp. AF23-6LB]